MISDGATYASTMDWNVPLLHPRSMTRHQTFDCSDEPR
jgi:hypothetical protein